MAKSLGTINKGMRRIPAMWVPERKTVVLILKTKTKEIATCKTFKEAQEFIDNCNYLNKVLR